MQKCISDGNLMITKQILTITYGRDSVSSVPSFVSLQPQQISPIRSDVVDSETLVLRGEREKIRSDCHKKPSDLAEVTISYLPPLTWFAVVAWFTRQQTLVYWNSCLLLLYWKC